MANNDTLIKVPVEGENNSQGGKKRVADRISEWFEAQGLQAASIHTAYSLPAVMIACSKEDAETFKNAVEQGALEGIASCTLGANTQHQHFPPSETWAGKVVTSKGDGGPERS